MRINKLPNLYFKIFISFLATCLLFFLGLAVFWNYYFSDLFYKDKKELLQKRSTEITKLLTGYDDKSISSRELRFGIRLLARSFNGQVWLIDSKGTVVYNSVDIGPNELPEDLKSSYNLALMNKQGFHLGNVGASGQNEILTYYYAGRMDQEPIVIFLHVPVMEISQAISAVRLNIIVPLLFSLIAVGLILYILSRKLAGPLQQMNKAALSLAEGDFNTRVTISSNDEMGQLANSFNFMIEQLQSWENTRQDFLANVSHELRSPLTTLRGLIAAMNDQIVPPDKFPQYLKICDYEVQRLQRLVSDLLDLARIQNGSDVYRLQPTDLVQTALEAVEILASAMDKKELECQTIMPPLGKPVVCELDPDRLAQIIQNLLYNAIQYTHPRKSIEVEVSEIDGEGVLIVRDTGIGMDEEQLHRIFERFYKADQSRAMQAEGTGLGMTIVKHLVMGMKGSILVESSKGEGSQFTIRFPLC